MAPPAFDFAGVDFSSYNPDFSVNTLPNTLSEVLESMSAPAPPEAPAVGSTVLEELGLGEEWQPVMDDLGL